MLTVVHLNSGAGSKVKCSLVHRCNKGGLGVNSSRVREGRSVTKE